MALRTASLCAGIGGLDLGVELAVPGSQLVVAVERQAFAASVLRSRLAGQALGAPPIWDDLETFDGRRWRGKVDIVVAGYPCQPESVAGLRRGQADERWLWRTVWRVVRDMGPRYLFVENVAGHLSGTFEKVVGDLAASGWSAEWDCFPASSVGAPHQRDRLFCLAANPERSPLRIQPEWREWDRRGERAPEREQAEPVDDGGPRQPADAEVERGARSEQHRAPSFACGHGEDSANADGHGLQGVGRSGELDTRERQELWRDAHGRDRARFGNTDGERLQEADGERLSAREEPLGEHDGLADPERDGHEGETWGRCDRAGWEAGELARGGLPYWQRVLPPEPTFRGMDDGTAHRLDRDWADRLYALGNAVVPQAAARAFATLWRRLEG